MEGIENSINPCIIIEMVDGSILSKIKQGIENNVIIPKIFNSVLNEYEMISFISFAKTKFFCFCFIFSIVSLKESRETSSLSLNEEIYKNVNPVKYKESIRSRNKLESFKFVFKIENKKLSEGKKMKFINRCASSFFISFLENMRDVYIALLGKPFKIPISIILAPLPLILNNG